MDITIREAKVSDSRAIAELARTGLGYDCDDELVKQRVAGLKENFDAAFVAETEGKVIGFIQIVKYEPLYFEDMVNIMGLAVSEEYRRKGIGSMLLKRAEEWAREHNIRCIRLNSGGQRTWAHEFYRNAGFDNEKMQIRFIKNM